MKNCVLAGVLSFAAGHLLAQSPPAFDIVLRHGTILDGSGLPRFRGDVAIAQGFIARVGDLSKERGAVDVDVSGLYVAPGFVNIHSHASPSALPTAENMLTQGVTTEIVRSCCVGGLRNGSTTARIGLLPGFGARAYSRPEGLHYNCRLIAGLNARTTTAVVRTFRSARISSTETRINGLQDRRDRIAKSSALGERSVRSA